MARLSWEKRRTSNEWKKNLSEAGKKGGKTNADRGSEYFRNMQRLSTEARRLRKKQRESAPIDTQALEC